MQQRHQAISEDAFNAAAPTEETRTAPTPEDLALVSSLARGVFTLAEDTIVTYKLHGREDTCRLVAGRKVIVVNTHRRALCVESGAVRLPGGKAEPLEKGTYLRLVKQ